MSNIPYSRTIGEGKTFLSPTDYQIYIDTKNGIATVVLPKIETVFNYFINGLGNPNSIFGYRFKDIGGNANINKIVFEGMDNDKINGVQKFDVNTSGASGILMISGINNYTLVSDVSITPPAPVNLLSVTYAQLTSLIGSSSLVQGQQYLLTDFRTKHIIPNTTDEFTGVVEPLILTAVSENKISTQVLSTTYPNDVLLYQVVDTSFQGGDMGRITYRLDTLSQLSTFYDWKNVKFRRWETPQGFFSLTDNGNAFQDFYTFQDSIKPNNSFSVFVPEFYEFGTPNYPSLNNTLFLNSAQTSFIETAYFGHNTFFDFVNNKISADCQYNKSVSEFYGNNISSIFTFNTFNNNVRGNNISSGSVDGGGFTNNSFKGVFSGNSIIGKFDANSIGNDFLLNKTSDYFLSNNIGDSFSKNNIGTNFTNNIIGNSFSYNIIADDFQSNTISDYFAYNTIGNYFNGNQIGAYFSDNIVENTFYNNTMSGGTCQSNHFKGLVSNNNFGGELDLNEIGDNFSNNSIGFGFKNNTIGTDFTSNSIVDNFRDNKISNGFHSNIILTWFNNNIVSNDFLNVDFSSATLVYVIAPFKYPKNITGKSDGTFVLSYIDGTNTVIYTSPTT